LSLNKHQIKCDIYQNFKKELRKIKSDQEPQEPQTNDKQKNSKSSMFNAFFSKGLNKEEIKS